MNSRNSSGGIDVFFCVDSFTDGAILQIKAIGTSILQL